MITLPKVQVLIVENMSGLRYKVIASFYREVIDGTIELAGRKYCCGNNTTEPEIFNDKLFSEIEIKEMLHPKMKFR